MKFGIREICDVVMKARTPMKVGKKVFYKDEPVIYFDTLKTSTLEGASTTVYATGGRGNTRLMAWDGERTITFTMEDALISAEGLMILTGAGLIEAGTGEKNSIKQHVIETTADVEFAKTGDEEGAAEDTSKVYIYLEHKPYMPSNGENCTYVMVTKDGEPITEPYIPVADTEEVDGKWRITVPAEKYTLNGTEVNYSVVKADGHDFAEVFKNATVLVDYYTERESNAKQIEITAESFGGNFYLEASTLFRNQDGADLPAEFIIPNCKVQSNFTFSMASSGDPSTFTFTLDAFPGYTRFDATKKVLAAIQVIEDVTADNMYRVSTFHNVADDAKFI